MLGPLPETRHSPFGVVSLMVNKYDRENNGNLETVFIMNLGPILLFVCKPLNSCKHNIPLLVSLTTHFL